MRLSANPEKKIWNNDRFYKGVLASDWIDQSDIYIVRIVVIR